MGGDQTLGDQTLGDRPGGIERAASTRGPHNPIAAKSRAIAHMQIAISALHCAKVR